MQPSKIIPHDVYAIKVGDKLVRFVVTRVVTTQVRTGRKSSPHDYESVVHGYVAGEDIEGDYEKRTRQVAPDQILGPYTDYAELVAKKEAEAKAAEENRTVEKAAAKRLVKLLYEKTGAQRNTKEANYRTGPFWEKYDNGIEVDVSGVVLLLKLLEGVEHANEAV